MDFIPISKPSIGEREIKYVTDAVKSGWVSSLGKYITKFEEKFAHFCGTKYALTTSNGTTAIHLALAVLGIEEGDEVLVPDLTFIATANAVVYTGAKPVFVDINKDHLCIDENEIEKKITSKTKAIIPVHLYGHPANMPQILKIAKKYNLHVVEDAAEAHGAEINGKKVGGWGDCATFSFYGNKVITSGEGGMITTNNQEIYEKSKHLRDHAMDSSKRYWHNKIGYNYRITNLQAALGLAQLERIEEIIKRKKEIFELYQTKLTGLKHLKLNYTADWAKNVYWMICLEVDNFKEKERSEFMLKLKEKGIDTRPYFYPISDMPMYQKAKTPITHSVYQKGVNLPSFYDMKDEEIEYICEIIKDILGE